MARLDAEKRTLYTLDAMRGVAALAVVFYHYNILLSPFLTSNGGLAVDLFFMMSGVVLARNYEPRFAAGMTSAGFMRVRVIRLYPLYLLSLAVAALVAMVSLAGHGAMGWTPRVLAQDALLGLFMLPSSSPSGGGQLFPLNVPTWSLFFELMINFAFVALWPWLTTRRLVAACLVCIPALVAIACRQGGLDAGWLYSTAWIGAVRTIFGFSLGIVIARRASPRAPSSGWLGFLVIIAGVCAALFVPPDIIGRPFWSLAWVVLLFPALVYAGTRFDPPRFLVPAASFAGVTSYALYVVHYPLLQFAASLASRFSQRAPAALDAVGGCALIVAFVAGAWALDKYFDAPARKMLRSRGPRSPWRGASAPTILGAPRQNAAGGTVLRSLRRSARAG